MNPSGNLSASYSCWPIILFIYNLSPGLYMKRKYMMLSMMNLIQNSLEMT